METDKPNPSELETKSNGWRYLFVAVAIGFFVICGLRVMMTSGYGRLRTETTLSDGRTVRVHHVTFGSTHTVWNTAGWKRTIQEYLPRPIARVIGPPATNISFATDQDVLIPWLTVDGFPIGPKKGGFQQLRLVSRGNQVFNSLTSRNDRYFDNSRVHRPWFRLFPRRDASITLTGMVDRLPFSVDLPNPLYGKPVPKWTANPFPATNRIGNVEVVFAPTSLFLYESGLITQFGMGIYVDGKDRMNWFSRSMTFADPTGNQNSRTPLVTEPVWRVDYTLTRRPNAPWNTNDFREFDLPLLPGPEKAMMIEVTSRLAGHMVHRIWIGGAGEFLLGPNAVKGSGHTRSGYPEKFKTGAGDIAWAREGTWLLCETDEVPDGKAMNIYITDSRGARLGCSHYLRTGPGVSRSYRAYSVTPVYDNAVEHRKSHPGQPYPSLNELSSPPYKLRIDVQDELQTSFYFDPWKIQRNNLTNYVQQPN